MIDVTQPLPPGFVAARPWQRFLAFCLDCTILNLLLSVMPLLFILLAFLGGHPSKEVTRVMLLMAGAAWPILFALYKGYRGSSPKQATFGELALGITLVGQDGNRISFSRALIRSWPLLVLIAATQYATLTDTGTLSADSLSFSGAALILFACLGAMLCCMSVVFTKDKQGWHDRLARCLVVRKTKES